MMIRALWSSFPDLSTFLLTWALVAQHFAHIRLMYQNHLQASAYDPKLASEEAWPPRRPQIVLVHNDGMPP